MKRDQRGIVSIVIVIMLIAVTTLITVGFSTIVRREQRQALDRQLSAQASLAAESVLNAKIAEFRQDPQAFTDSITAASANTCTDQNTKTFGASSDEIVTTCVMINNAPGPLEFDEVTTGDSKVVWLDPDGNSIDRIFITWQNPRAITTNDCQTTPYSTLPTSLSGTSVGMVRFDLTRIGPGNAGFTRDSLRSNNFGGVLYPRSGGTTTQTFTGSSAGQPLIFGACGGAAPSQIPDPYAAYAEISIPASVRNNTYMLRLRGLYKASHIKVVGYNNATNSIVNFRNAQIVMEVTARTGDVVQRIQARVPASSPPMGIFPNSALHVTNDGVCKLLVTEPASTTEGC